MKKIKAVHDKRKESQSGKRLSFKNRPLSASENITKALKASEKPNKAKKKLAAGDRRKHRRKAKSNDKDGTGSSSDSSDSSNDSDVEILDCIEVA